MKEETAAREQRIDSGRAAARAALFAAGMAAVLAICKFLLFWKTGLLIVALSAFDSAVDVLVSFVNHRIIRYARMDADSDHPYGHGKAESIAALGQGALIAGAAVTILSSSVQRLINGEQTIQSEHQYFSIVFFVVAAISSEAITRFLRHFSKKHRSPALLGDSAHYRSDVLANLGSAVALAVVYFVNKPWLDPLIAGVLALYIAYSGLRLLRSTIDDLMDHDLPLDVKDRALALIAETSDKIIDVHRFRGRRSGHRYFFDFHITLPDNLSFREIHEISELVENKLSTEFDADVTVHVDPESIPISSQLALSRRDPTR